MKSHPSVLAFVLTCLFPAAVFAQYQDFGTPVYYVDSPVVYTGVANVAAAPPVEILNVESVQATIPQSSNVVQVPPILSSVVSLGGPVVKSNAVGVRPSDASSVSETSGVSKDVAKSMDWPTVSEENPIIEKEREVEASVAVVDSFATSTSEVQAPIYTAPAKSFYLPMQPQAAVCTSGG